MQLTIEQFNERLVNLTGLISGNLATDTIAPAGLEMLASIKKRIYAEGRNSNDSNIGKYSTKPMYVEPKQFIKGGFHAQGKRNVEGNTIGDRLIPTVRLKKTGVKKNPATYQKYSLVKPNLQERKTMYLKEGYKELRDIQSLRTDIVNFSYSGKTLADYQQQQREFEVLQGFVSERSSNIRQGLEKKKGRTFYPTQSEIEQYKRRSSFLIARLATNILKGTELEPYYVTAEIN